MSIKKYLLILIGLCFFFAPRANASISRLHLTSSTPSGSVSASVLTVSSTNSGDLLIAIWSSDQTPPSGASVTSSNGAVFTKAGCTTVKSGSLGFCLFYLANSSSGVTSVGYSGFQSSPAALGYAEYSGVATTGFFDASSSAVQATATTTYNSGSITTSQSGDLLVGYTSLVTSRTITKPSAWNAVYTNTGEVGAFFDLLGSGAAGTYAATGTLSGTSVVGTDIFAFKVAGAVTPPNATSASTTVNGNGARSGDTITITGTNFGSAGSTSTATCNGSTGTGCVQFVVGGTATVASASISSWTNTAITFTVSSTLASNGGTSSLEVWAADASDTTPLTFYIYPHITSLASVGTNAARTYTASDTDGLIMLAGDHFGTSGTSSIFGVLATQYASIGGACSVGGYTSTSACFEVPSSTISSTYSGTITLTRSSDGTQATTSLSILPRISAINPASTYEGSLVQVLGDHLCGPSGTCPVSPNRASGTNNVTFGNTMSTDSGFVNQTGGGGTCNGSSAAWAGGEICLGLPIISAGSASATITSNSNASNIFSFTVTTPPTPGTPGAPTYASVTSSTLTVNWTSSANSDYYILQRATSSQIYAQVTTTTSLSYADSGLTANTQFYYEVAGVNTGGTGMYATSTVFTAPNAPGTPTYTNLGSSTLTINWTAPAGGATYYILQRATSSQIYAQVTTTTSLSANDSGLSLSTTYYYRILGANSTGSGQASASSSVTTTNGNVPPNAPSQDSPSNGVQDLTTTPVFKMTATDPNGDNLQYKVLIYNTSGCSSGLVQTDDESASQTGWSGQNASSSREYSSGTQGVFTTQSALSANTTYYWTANAKDPEGSNTWTASASCNSFSTSDGIWTTDSGSWSISGNRLVVTPSSGASVQIHATGVSQTNGVIELKVESSAVGSNTGNVAGIVRADTGANRYHLAVADFLNQQGAIGKTISSAYSTITSGSFTFSGGTLYDLRGSISGTTLASWINGGNALSTTDSALSSAGNIGIAVSSTNGTATFTIDDFAFYSSTIITMNNLPVGGSWSARDHSGTVISCQTGSTWNLATYSGQVPIDYDNGGGSVAVWGSSNSCSGAPDQTYPSSGLATDIFGGDTYSYTAGSSSTATQAGTVISTSTITISLAGAVSGD